MKNPKYLILTGALLLAATATTVMAETQTTKTTTAQTSDAQKAATLISRLYEIRSMDRNRLNAEQKQALRGEVHQIQSQLQRVGGGIYLSAGAIIVILIILILIL